MTFGFNSFLGVPIVYVVGKMTLVAVSSLSGFLASDLRWCGQVEPPGINDVDCPTGCGINNTDLSILFWRQVSSHASTNQYTI